MDDSRNVAHEEFKSYSRSVAYLRVADVKDSGAEKREHGTGSAKTIGGGCLCRNTVSEMRAQRGRGSAISSENLLSEDGTFCIREDIWQKMYRG